MEFNAQDLSLLESAVRTWMTVAQSTLANSDDEDEIAEITNDLTAMEILLSRICSPERDTSP
jgi:hypothetical protein